MAGSEDERSSVQLSDRKESSRKAARKYREKKKNDPDFKKKDRERKKNQRKILQERLKENPEEKARLKELNKIRQARFRERKKIQVAVEAENKEGDSLPIPAKRLTRAEHERKKQYWREKKRTQRANMTSQKKRRIREYDRRRKKNKVPFDQIEQDEPSMPSSCTLLKNAVKQRVYRVKKSMPKTPEEFVQVVSHLIKNATPKKKELLKQAGLSSSPQKQADRCISTLANLKENVLKNSKDKHWKVVKKYLAFALRSVKKAKSYKQMSQDTGISYKLVRKYTAKTDTDVCEALKRKPRSDALDTQAIMKDVEAHFIDSASFVPDKKAVNKKTLEPKKVLFQPVAKVYEDFKKKHPNAKISSSKFHQLRPKNVQTTSHQKLYQSRCEYCSNPELKLNVLNKLCDSKGMPECKIKDKYKLMNITLCPKQKGFHSKNCLQRKCNECGISGLMNHLEGLVKTTGNQVLIWHHWGTKKYDRPGKAPSTRKVMETVTGTVFSLIEDLEKELEGLPYHLFVANWQKQQFDHLSKGPPANSLVMHLDFSENYSTFYQQEVSSAHWMKNLITVHPIVAFYKCPDCEPEGTTSTVMDVLVFLSDDNKHDYHAVQEFMAKSINFLRDERNVDFSKIHEFTDGCSSQYKSRGPLVDLSYGQEDFGVTRERKYFGSCHGKGPSDGAGAVTKTAARRSVIRDTAIITDALSRYTYLKEKCSRLSKVNNICNHSRRAYFLIDGINRNRPERECKVTLKGTRQIHEVRGLTAGTISTRILACACSSCQDGYGLCVNEAYVGSWEVRHLETGGARTRDAGARTRGAGARTRDAGARTRGAGARTRAAGARTRGGGVRSRGAGARTRDRGRRIVRRRKGQRRESSDEDSDLSDQEVLTQTGVDSAVSMQVESEVSTQVDTDSDVFQTTGGGVCKKSSSLSVITHVSANDLVKIPQIREWNNSAEIIIDASCSSDDDLMDISGLSGILQSLEEASMDCSSPTFPYEGSMSTDLSLTAKNLLDTPVNIETPPVNIETLPVNIETPPVNIETPPVNIETLPVNIETPPVNIETLPVNMETPPVNMETPPVNIETPPVNIETPPVNIETPPVNIETPPVNIETPPVNKETPPVNIETTQVNIETPPVNYPLSEVKKSYSTGQFLKIAHGSRTLPAVVDRWPFVQFFQEKRKGQWTEQTVCHTVVLDDVLGSLEPPDISVMGSRMFYTFNDL